MSNEDARMDTPKVISDDSRTASEDRVTPVTLTPASPLPWEICGVMVGAESVEGAVQDQRGYVVATTHEPACAACGHHFGEYTPLVEEQDARYIVRAANSYPALVRALKELHRHADSYANLSRVQGPSLRDEAAHQLRNAIAVAREALKIAEGQP